VTQLFFVPELHHFGYSACKSCPDPEKAHKYIVAPGFFSGNIHIIDVGSDPLKPHLVKVCVRGKIFGCDTILIDFSF
jgi:hypothetical protein